MFLLQNSIINQSINPVTSNQVSSYLFICHSHVNDKGKSYYFAYKGCAIESWIIDSGASDHICSSSSWFISHDEVQPINVRLPNDHYLARHVGTIKFSPDFIITSVLYIPGFSVNLVSVSKLCQQSKFKFSFTHNHYFI